MIGGLDRRLIDHFDWPVFWLVITIIVIGLFNLFSATFHLSMQTYLVPQLYWFGLGMVALLFALVVDYRFLERIAYPAYIAVVALLAFVLFKGRLVSGARRWIDLGFFMVQPSELAKLVIIITLARYFHHRKRIGPLGFFELLIPGSLTAIPAFLILVEPDLGTALTISFISVSMILMSGVRWKAIVAILVTVAVLVPFAWMFVLKDYQKERVRTFLDPERDPLGSGYQVIQAKIAVGSGLFLGRGYLKGTQSKLQFLPKQHTDFIMSNYCEEWGFLGSIVLLFLFGMLLVRGIEVAANAKELFGSVLAYGITAFLFWQIFINIGMELGLLPVVGMTLPFFSYGGSSLMTNMFAAGLLLNVSMRRYMF